jgi:hypothetical protein
MFKDEEMFHNVCNMYLTLRGSSFIFLDKYRAKKCGWFNETIMQRVGVIGEVDRRQVECVIILISIWERTNNGK